MKTRQSSSNKQSGTAASDRNNDHVRRQDDYVYAHSNRYDEEDPERRAVYDKVNSQRYGESGGRKRRFGADKRRHHDHRGFGGRAAEVNQWNQNEQHLRRRRTGRMNDQDQAMGSDMQAGDFEQGADRGNIDTRRGRSDQGGYNGRGYRENVGGAKRSKSNQGYANRDGNNDNYASSDEARTENRHGSRDWGNAHNYQHIGNTQRARRLAK